MSELNQAHAIDDSVVQMKAFTPVASNERIEAIDVVRGFALFGIFFMNIEWFNRLMVDFSMGIPTGLSKLDWAAHYFVNYFVAGKFWTIFSLLFGVGFAVMLTRSEESGREFLVPYVRRIIALAAFGAIHQIFLWPGDILLSYAFTAAGLLVILFGTPTWVLGLIILFFAITAIPGFSSFGIIPTGLTYMGVIALYYRSEKRVSFLGKPTPLFSVILAALSLLVLAFGIFAYFVPSMRVNSTATIIGASVFLVTAFFSAAYREPASRRLLRGGVWIYLTPFVIGFVFLLTEFNKPYSNVFDNPQAVQLADKKQAEKAAKEKLEKEQKLAGKPALASANAIANASASASVTSSANASDSSSVGAPASLPVPAVPASAANTFNKSTAKNSKEAFDPAKKKLEDDADRIVNIRERLAAGKVELAAMTTKSYAEFLQFRFDEFKKNAFNAAGTGFLAIAMFMIGVWSFRSGIVGKVQENLPLFRRLALFGLPLGWSLSILASLISTHQTRGADGENFGLAMTILEMANLPTCIAYVSLLVLALYSNTIFSKVRLLAPYGRMALTNYLSQSLIQATFFYGWGFGHFGMGRAAQLGFAVCVIFLQIVFSHLWLSKFRYGPLEYVWRAITYWKLPAFRI